MLPKFKTVFWLVVLLFSTREKSFSQFSIQKCVMEWYTGTWVGYETDAAVVLDGLLQTYDKLIPVSIHNGDSMEIPDGIYLQSFYTSAYPMATFNRLDAAISRGFWSSTTSTVLAGASTATVTFDSVWYNASTRQLDLDLRVTFTGSETGNMRFNCIVVEDSVTGSGLGYDQTNYYNTTSGHPYFGAGNPIVNYVHRFVSRSYLGGPFGTPGIIPASVSFGSTYQHHYSYVIPSGYDIHQISLVGLVSKYEGTGVTERSIINAETFDLDDAYVIDLGTPEAEEPDFILYPNPASSFITARFYQPAPNTTLEIYSMDGRFIKSVATGNATFFSIAIDDLAPGSYLIACGERFRKFIKSDY